MELSEVIVRICKVLDKNRIAYMIIGGQAVSVHGYPRLTEDIDITLGLNVSDAEKILNLLPDLNAEPLTKDPSDFIKTTWVLPVKEKDSGIKIDFTFSFSDYEQQAIQNAKRIDVAGYNVSFCSLEDLIIHKVFAGRPRDLEDVKNLYVKNKRVLNRDYILQWLKSFDSSVDGNKINYTKIFIEIEKTEQQ